MREAKRNHEKRMAGEVRREKSGKKMWKMIDKLKGKGIGYKRKKLYGENGGEVMEESDERELMLEYWRGIYQREENYINDAWNLDERREYEERRRGEIVEQEALRIERLRREIPGIPILRVVEGVEEWMERVEFGVEDVIKRIKSCKKGKQPGMDGIRGEIYRALEESEVCVSRMVEAYNRVLKEGGRD